MKFCFSLIIFLNFFAYNIHSEECGVRPEEDVNSWRIVGGHNSRPGSWPWMASIRLKSEPNFRVCGATLISNTWILVAAHCVQVDDDPLNWVVVFDALNTTDGKEIFFRVSKVWTIELLR